MISKINSIILFINISQSLLININNIYYIQFSTYIIIGYEMLIILSFIIYLYYERTEYIKNEKHKKVFNDMNELHNKYLEEIKKKNFVFKNKEIKNLKINNQNVNKKTSGKNNLSIKNINRSVSDPTKYNKIYQGVNYKHGLIKNYLYFTHIIKKKTDIKNKNEKNLRIVKL